MNTLTPEPEVLDRVFRSLSSEDRAEILSIGAAFRRLSLEKRLTWAESKVQAFEARYHATLNQLEATGLPEDADHAMHEDYVEWHYWSRVVERTKKTLNALVAISPAPEPARCDLAFSTSMLGTVNTSVALPHCRSKTSI